MPLHGIVIFDEKQLFERILKYQKETKDDPQALKHPKNRDIPKTFDKMNWQDLDYVESFLCKHTEMYYQQI